jgi:hypothetical protein
MKAYQQSYQHGGWKHRQGMLETEQNDLPKGRDIIGQVAHNFAMSGRNRVGFF